ncbi:c2H2-type domain-containing protein [Trichonephila clavipes]|nr:c2H2-type domain-containing protein [Trichonephila clavipes]
MYGYEIIKIELVFPTGNQVANVEDFLRKYTSYLQQMNHPSSVALLPAMENVCPICLKTYSTKHSMKRHLLMHKPFHRRFQCAVCQKLFNWPGNLKTHMQTVHMQLPANSRPNRTQASSASTSTITSNSNIKKL